MEAIHLGLRPSLLRLDVEGSFARIRERNRADQAVTAFVTFNFRSLQLPFAPPRWYFVSPRCACLEKFT
jgi:hypothetical protein